MTNHENSALRRGLSVIGKLLAGTRNGPSGERARHLKKLQKRIGVRFTDISLLEQALTHRSYSHVTAQTRNDSNERMEFLGDSVLGLSVSQFLYLRFPERSEGALSKMKSLLVSRKVLSTVSRELGLGEYLLLSGEESDMGGRGRTSILADSFEGVIGAIYLDQGYRAANKFVRRFLLANISEILKDEEHTNYKSLLQEHVQSKRLSHPIYRVRREEGPEHEKEFAVDVVVRGDVWGSGRGKSKKEAEQSAARGALEARQGIGQGKGKGRPGARSTEHPRTSASAGARTRTSERPPERKAVARKRAGHGMAASREKLRAQRQQESEKERAARETRERRRPRRRSADPSAPRRESEPESRRAARAESREKPARSVRPVSAKRPRRPARSRGTKVEESAPEKAREAVAEVEPNGSGTPAPERKPAQSSRRRSSREPERQEQPGASSSSRDRAPSAESTSAPPKERKKEDPTEEPKVAVLPPASPEVVENQNGRGASEKEDSSERATKEGHSFHRRKRRTVRGLRRR